MSDSLTTYDKLNEDIQFTEDETRELLKLSISQQYNIDEKRRDQKLGTDSRRPAGDIDIEAKSSIINKLSLIQKATYASYEKEINKYSTAVRYSIGRNGY